MPKKREILDPVSNLLHECIFDPPVRNVVRPTTRRVVGQMYSRKRDGLVDWESQIEKKCLEWLEVNPDILVYNTQPMLFTIAGRKYTPDIAVIGRTGQYYVEVKPDSIFEDEEALERVRSHQRHFEAAGTELKLITEKDVASHPLRANVNLLLRHTRKRPNIQSFEALVKACSGAIISIEELLERMNLPRNSTMVLDAIVFGYFAIDLTKPISLASYVTPYEGELV